MLFSKVGIFMMGPRSPMNSSRSIEGRRSRDCVEMESRETL